MFFAANRRRPSRRFAFSFESLQTRITPSDISGAGGTVESSDDFVITPEMYDAFEMTMPTNDTSVGDSTAQSTDLFTMTVPTTSC